MDGLLIIAVMVTLLILALGPSHRRAGHTWRPGFETRNDRDRARLAGELRFAADPDPDPDLGAGSQADPDSAERPRSGRTPVPERRRSTGTGAFDGSREAA